MGNKLSLNGTWELLHALQVRSAAGMEQPEFPEGATWIPASVPGTAELELCATGELPENLWKGTNIYDLRKVEKHQWWYRRSFHLDRLPEGSRWHLEFEGVDTLATVWLNGIRLGRMENMLIPHRFEVTDLLQSGENTVVVGIDSAVLAGMQAHHPPGERSHDANWESLHIRKAAHNFGWDIFPRAVTHGIWRTVRLQRIPEWQFEDVTVATKEIDPEARSAKLWVAWRIDAPLMEDLDDWTVRFQVLDGEQSVYSEDRPVLGRHSLIQPELTDINAWWPRGYGPQPLYTLRLDLLDPTGERVITHSHRTGFRTVRLEKTDCIDEDGNGRFAFVVNGEEVFMKGTNWVPLDAFHSRDAERLEETLDLACDLNCNMIRCWGGGVYEDHAFFDRCDEEGILIWQDFMLACSLYPQTPEFHGKIRKEAEAVVARLRNHPSLALWAGNNEIDLFYSVLLPHLDPNEADETSRRVLASVCRQQDPWRDYLPSSPYFAPELHALGSPYERRPEDHLWWGPRDDYKATYFKDSPTLFVSEIGFGGVPCRRSLEKMLTRENLWPYQDNEEWLAHIVRPQPRGHQFTWRLDQLDEPVRHLFGEVPDNLDDFIFAGQFAQAEAMKYFIERWRIRKHRCSGILWWNLRDGWPVISPAVVDYFGEKTMSYHTIKRVQTDVCVMVDEAVDGMHGVVAVNDTRETASLSFTITHGKTLLLEADLELTANGRAVAGQIPASPDPACWILNGKAGGSPLMNHYLAGPAPLNLETCREWYSKLEIPEPSE